MPPPLLPDPITTYFAADQRSDETIAQCFTPEAVVKDEGHAYRGREAIKAWKSEASAAYTFKSEPFAVGQQDGLHVVTSRVTGNFPGSPVDLRYRFRLERALIATLEITP